MLFVNDWNLIAFFGEFYSIFIIKENKMEQDKNWWPTVIDSALGAIPVVGATAQNAFAAWRNKNISVARDVLLSNIRAGDVSAIHQDELFSMLARITRPIQEGKAKSNLILLARLVSGIGHADKENAKAETFNQYADMLENLTLEEIELLAFCIKNGVIPDGFEEIKQSLCFKGFFVSDMKTSVDLKKGASFPIMPKYANTARTFAEEQALYSNKEMYDAKTVNVYYLSKRFNNFLTRYGNLWEGLSKEGKD